jgi:hypothetical protein
MRCGLLFGTRWILDIQLFAFVDIINNLPDTTAVGNLSMRHSMQDRAISKGLPPAK